MAGFKARMWILGCLAVLVLYLLPAKKQYSNYHKTTLYISLKLHRLSCELIIAERHSSYSNINICIGLLQIKVVHSQLSMVRSFDVQQDLFGCFPSLLNGVAHCGSWFCQPHS